MNRWHFLGITIFILLVPSPLLYLRPQPECDGADRLFGEGKFEEALIMYNALLRENSDLRCAQKGKPMAEAALRAQSEQLYQLGQTYEKWGKSGLALEAYKNALEKEPIILAIQREYVSENSISGDENEPSTFTGIIEGTAGKIIAVGEQIAPYAIIIVALLVFLKISPRIYSYFTAKPSLDIKRFDMGTTGLDIGGGLAARIEDEFMRAVDLEDNPLKINVVEGPITGIPADIKSSGPSSLKMIFEFIDWVFPRKVITLSGCLQESEEYGAGLTLKLIDNQTKVIVATCTMWEKDYNPDFCSKKKPVNNKDPTPYYCLMRPAAHWIHFQFAKHQEIGEDEFIYKFGTEDWQSYIFFKTGIYWEEKANKRNLQEIHQKPQEMYRRPQEMYRRALSRDINNRYALLNLGCLRVEETAINQRGCKTTILEGYEEALKLLKRAKNLAERCEENLEWLQSMRAMMEPEKTDSILVQEAKDFSEKCEKDMECVTWLKKTFGLARDKKLLREAKNSLLKCEKDMEWVQLVRKAMKSANDKDSVEWVDRISTNYGRTRKLLRWIGEILGLDCDMFECAKDISKIDEENKEWLQLVKKISETNKNKIHIDNVWYIAAFQIVAASSYMGYYKEEKGYTTDIYEKAKKNAHELHEAVQQTVKSLQIVQGNMSRILRGFSRIARSLYLMASEEFLEKKVPIEKHLVEAGHVEKYLLDLRDSVEILYKTKLICSEESNQANETNEANERFEEIRKRSGPKFNYSIQYNLACYHSVRGFKKDEPEEYERALECLERALLQRDHLLWWAEYDPSLKFLREYREDEFEELIKKYAPVEQNPVSPQQSAHLGYLDRHSIETSIFFQQD
jgi:tetratricopeptide (TPR) repeat protein